MLVVVITVLTNILGGSAHSMQSVAEIQRHSVAMIGNKKQQDWDMKKQQDQGTQAGSEKIILVGQVSIYQRALHQGEQFTR